MSTIHNIHASQHRKTNLWEKLGSSLNWHGPSISPICPVLPRGKNARDEAISNAETKLKRNDVFPAIRFGHDFRVRTELLNVFTVI